MEQGNSKMLHEIYEAVSATFAKTEHLLTIFIFSTLNILIRPAEDSKLAYFLHFTISVIVAMIVGLVCDDMGITSGIKHAVVAASTLLARDLLTFITGFGTFVTVHKDSLYRKLIKKGIDRLGSKD